MLLGCITALILALPLAAQTTYDGVGSLSSNTKAATATIFSTDVDNFINYHKYSSVKFDNWFGFITGRPSSGTSTPAVLDLGFARNFGSLYLGAWYRGNMFRSGNGSETQTITPTYDSNSLLLTQTVKTIDYDPVWNESTNQIEFLIGVAGQGFKLGFFESLSSNKHAGNPDRNVTTTDYRNGTISYQNAIDEYSVSKGRLKPYLGWGTNIGIGGANLMPYIDVSLAMDSDSQVDNYRNYTTFNGKTQTATTSVGAGHDNAKLRPEGTVGFKLDLAKKETTQTTLELKYKILLEMPGSTSEASGRGGGVDGDVSWNSGYVNRVTNYINRTETTTSIRIDVDEYTNIAHTATPIYKITGEPADGFRVGFLAQVPVTLSEQTNRSYNNTYTINKTKYKGGDLKDDLTNSTIVYSSEGEEVTSTISAQLRLSLGASYKLIPDRFAINAGISAIPVTYSHRVETESPDGQVQKNTQKTTDGYGNVLSNSVAVTKNDTPDKVTTTDTWMAYTATLSGGFTFYFTPTAALDLLVAAGAANTFRLDVTDVNVLFSIKF
jgi:hypothetical protein